MFVGHPSFGRSLLWLPDHPLWTQSWEQHPYRSAMSAVAHTR